MSVAVDEDYVPQCTEGLSLEEFCTLYPYAVIAAGLLVPDSKEPAFLTRPGGTGPLLAAPGARPAHGIELIRVRKRGENPFAQMITIGRAPNNDVVLRSSDLSKFHAYLQETDEGGWTITDAGSTNGTFIGGARMAPRETRELELGVSIYLASAQLTLLQGPQLYYFLSQFDAN